MKYLLLIIFLITIQCSGQVTIPTDVAREILADLERFDLQKPIIEKQDLEIAALKRLHYLDSVNYLLCRKEVGQLEAIVKDAKQTAGNVDKIHRIEKGEVRRRSFLWGVGTGAVSIVGLIILTKQL